MVALKKALIFNKSTALNSGDRGTRTPDLYVANVSLSQLSYIPMNMYVAGHFGQSLENATLVKYTNIIAYFLKNAMMSQCEKKSLTEHK